MENLNDWKKAGEIAAETRDYGKSLLEKGFSEKLSLLDVTEKIEARIFQLKGKPAFPVQISLNNTAAHYNAFVDDKTIIKDDVVKLDIGVHVNGAIGDTAVTVCLNKEHDELVKASEKALENALKIIKPGLKLWKIGEEIENTILSLGFKPVKNLTGHSIELYNEHAGLTIPNFNNHDDTKLKENEVIAIEPFATTGVGFIDEKKNYEIYKVISDHQTRDAISRSILMFMNENYNGLPFSKRWLVKKFKPFEVNFALNNLIREGIVMEYKHLVEKSNGTVSQSEHSVLVKDKPIILTKR